MLESPFCIILLLEIWILCIHLQSADLPWIPESFCGLHYHRNVEESYGNFNKTTVIRERVPFSFSYSDL